MGEIQNLRSGTVLLDFDADACQSPSRAYLLDVTLPGMNHIVTLMSHQYPRDVTMTVINHIVTLMSYLYILDKSSQSL